MTYSSSPELNEFRGACAKAIARLTALQHRAQPASFRTQELHAESTKLYAEYVRAILEVTSDLHIEATEIVVDMANLGAMKLSDKEDIRAMETVRGLLTDADDAADRMIEEAEFGEDYYPVKRRVG